MKLQLQTDIKVIFTKFPFGKIRRIWVYRESTALFAHMGAHGASSPNGAKSANGALRKVFWPSSSTVGWIKEAKTGMFDVC